MLNIETKTPFKVPRLHTEQDFITAVRTATSHDQLFYDLAGLGILNEFKLLQELYADYRVRYAFRGYRPNHGLFLADEPADTPEHESSRPLNTIGLIDGDLQPLYPVVRNSEKCVIRTPARLDQVKRMILHIMERPL